MGNLRDSLLNMLSQFAGGPGPPENDVVRFGLAAILWGTLLVTAWSRVHSHNLARERLLVIGFGLAFFRELFRLGHLSFKLIGGGEDEVLHAIIVPTEHALALASVILISGAYLRYMLNDAPLTKRYLTVGLGVAALASLLLAVWWPQLLLADPTVEFHTTRLAVVFHLLSAGLIAAAIVVLIRRRGWLRNAIIVALSLLLVSEFLVIVDFVTDQAFYLILSPVGNAIYLLALPIFGYVYYHERQNEQLAAEAALRSYREHLEELVRVRTVEITSANIQLQDEIGERKHAEMELTKRNAELAAQNAIAEIISRGVDLDTILRSALAWLLDLMAMQYGCVFLIDRESGSLVFRIKHLAAAVVSLPDAYDQPHQCCNISQQAIDSMAPVVINAPPKPSPDSASLPQTQGIYTFVSIPLISQNHAVGTLTLAAPTREDFSSEVLNLLTAIGQQIGVAVERTSLYHQLELAAALEERQRIAAEMHDGLAQTLSYLGHKTDCAAELLVSGQIGQTTEICHQIRAAISQATYEVRRSIASLQEKPAPRESLQEALGRTVADVRLGDPTTINMTDALTTPLFLPAAELEQVLHVCREAMTNALRHAGAQTIQVSLEVSMNRVIVMVQDDGCGFSVGVPPLNAGDHFGISIMHARSARVGAELTIQSEAGVGTCVMLALPLATEMSK